MKTRIATTVEAAAKAATHGEAEGGHGRRVAHAPDVVQAGPVVAEQAVAHQRERVGERQEPRDPRERRREGA